MRYKVTHEEGAVYTNAAWNPYSDPRKAGESGSDGGTYRSIYGFIWLFRSWWGSGSWASVEFVLKGRQHRWVIQPAPTRAGLVRMAANRVRKVALETKP